MEVKTLYETSNILGEGPVWSPEEQALYWVDIERPSIQRLEIGTDEYTAWEMPSRIGCFAFRERGGIIAALRSGLTFFDPEHEIFTPIVDPEADIETNRFNDGKCDRNGRLWAGTMHLTTSEPTGALYRYESGGKLQKMREKVTCSNGLGWSPDNRTMYYTDTPTNTIFAYDYEEETGNISNVRPFAQVSGEDGFPDGLTVDAEGYVWSAMWDGWRIIRYAPDGSVDKEIKMPVQRPTSCTFGGPDLTHLYVTSASVNLTDEELEQQPLAGSVFVIETGVKGMLAPKFAG